MNKNWNKNTKKRVLNINKEQRSNRRQYKRENFMSTVRGLKLTDVQYLDEIYNDMDTFMFQSIEKRSWHNKIGAVMKHYNVKGKKGRNFAKYLINNYWDLKIESLMVKLHNMQRRIHDLNEYRKESDQSKSIDVFIPWMNALYEKIKSAEYLMTHSPTSQQEFCMISQNSDIDLEYLSKNNEYWIRDTGSSTHDIQQC